METENAFDATTNFESYYMNQMQILANVIDANNVFAEVDVPVERQKVSPVPASSAWPTICPENFPSWFIRHTSPS